MKTLAVITLAFSLPSLAATVYDCTGGSYDSVKVEVISTKKIIINDKDVAKVNAKDLADTSKKSVGLVGTFKTLGDGAEGYSVDVKVTRYLLNKSRIAYLNTYNRGPEGFYSDSCKCTKR